MQMKLLLVVGVFVSSIVYASEDMKGSKSGSMSNSHKAVSRVKEIEQKTSPADIDKTVKNMSRSHDGARQGHSQNKSRASSLPKPIKVMSQSHNN